MKSKFSVFVIAVFSIVGFAMLPAGNVLAEQELTRFRCCEPHQRFPEIGKKFESTKSRDEGHFNFAASGPLLQQIEQGAPLMSLPRRMRKPWTRQRKST